MPFESQQDFIDNAEWKPQKSGQYNNVSISTENFTSGDYTGRWVLKRPKDKDSLLNQVDRAIGKWNQLNPSYPALKANDGWMVPYFGNIPASDQAIAKKLIDIYLKTRNIIADAPHHLKSYNFLLYNDKVICIDVDLALRRGSPASDLFDITQNANHQDFLLSHKEVNNCLKSIAVIETLTYLEKNFSEHEIKDEYITPRLIEILHTFRLNDATLTIDTMDVLLAILNHDTTHQIDSRYITPEFVKKIQGLRIDNIISKELIATCIHELFLNLSDEKRCFPQLLAIAEFTIQHNNALINKTNEDGYTLLHAAVIHKQADLVSLLIHKGADLNITASSMPSEGKGPRFPSMTAMDIALCTAIDNIIPTLLANAGAHISQAINFLLPNGHTLTAKELCAMISQSDFDRALIERFRVQLVHLAQNTGNLTEEKKTELLSLVTQNLHVLTWHLVERPFTFLHHVFAQRNTHIINELSKLSQWQSLSQIKPSFFTQIASLGYVEYYDLLKHIPTKASDWTEALQVSIQSERTEFYNRLLKDDANPNSEGKKYLEAYEYWKYYHPRKKNPFIRPYALENRKAQILECIKWMISEYQMPELQEKILLNDFFTTISQLFFTPTDDPNKTAEDLLVETIDSWISHQPKNTMTNQNQFFPRTNDVSELIEKVILPIKDTLVSLNLKKNTDFSRDFSRQEKMAQFVRLG